jgi:putative hydrolase
MNKIDLHVHTIASGHAMNTIYELVAAAKERDMEALAITDHGPGLEGGAIAPYFQVLGARVPDYIDGIRVFKGIEANVLDGDGRTDLDSYTVRHLELVIVGTHPITSYQNLGEAGNAQAIAKAFKASPAIDILAHPVNVWFPIDIETVVRAACEEGVAIELNESTMSRSSLDQEKQKKLVRATLRHGGRFVISSDSHIASELGGNARVKALIAELDVPRAAIINRSLEETQAFIDSRKHRKR